MRVLFETQGQGFIFLQMACLGLCLGLMDQMIGLIWRKGHQTVGLFAGIVAGGLGAIGCICLLVQAEQGELRAYGLLGIIIGWLVYALGVGQLVNQMIAIANAIAKEKRKVRNKANAKS